MADLFQLPDGRRVRKGSEFTLPKVQTYVSHAIVGTDGDGNETIEKPARLSTRQVDQYFPSNWLNLATPAMLREAGIEPLEEDQPADGRFYFSGDGPVKKGRLTQVVTPREIETIQAWLVSEIKERTRGTILARFPIEKQLTMQMRLMATDTDQETRDDILAGHAWIEDVLAHGTKLEAEAMKLTSAKAAEAWYGKPWDYPEFE